MRVFPIQSKTQILSLLIFTILLFSEACSLFKSATRREAEQQAQTWWDSTFVKCGNDYYAMYEGRSLVVGVLPNATIKKGFIQFKNLSYKLEEETLPETARLNGVEWRGNILIPVDTSFRYYGLDSSKEEKKWSSWRSEPLIYAPDLFDKVADLGAKYSGTEASPPKSPQIIYFSKFKGQWKTPSNEGFKKPDCSEIPKE